MPTINYKYIRDRDIIGHLELEDDDDIKESSLKAEAPKAAKNGKGINIVFLNLTPAEWRVLGIRDSLWGQSRVIDGVCYCYGRWHEESDYQRSEKYPEPVNEMSELAIGIAHEASHGAHTIKGKEDLTHAHFYGYQEKRDDDEQDRWAVTPTPMDAFRELLDDDDVVNLYCIRSGEVTEKWKEQIREAGRIMGASSRIERLQKKVIALAEKVVAAYRKKIRRYEK